MTKKRKSHGRRCLSHFMGCYLSKIFQTNRSKTVVFLVSVFFSFIIAPFHTTKFYEVFFENFLYLEDQEFASPGKYAARYCKGRLCNNCGKCRDWQYTGDPSSWKWIQNYNNWTDEDWQRWQTDKYSEKFQRRHGYTCRLSVYGGYLGLDGSFDANGDCLCDNNRKAS